ncbi:MAG: hypothetical protein V8Q84_06580 [Bilophila sp.]
MPARAYSPSRSRQRGSDRFEGEVVRGQIRGLGRGKGGGHVLGRAHGDDAGQSLQGAEVHVVLGGLHQYGEPAEGGFERHGGGVGSPDRRPRRQEVADGPVHDFGGLGVAVEVFQPPVHGEVRMRLDDDLPAVQKPGLGGGGQRRQMGVGFVREEAGDHEQARGFDLRRGFFPGLGREIEIAQGLHQRGTLFGHVPDEQGVARAGPVAQPQFGHGAAAGRIINHARIIEITEVGGTHR